MAEQLEAAKVIDTSWSDEITERFNQASEDLTPNAKKDWMLDRVCLVAYHIDCRPDCSTCQSLKAEIENLYNYFVANKNGAYEVQREFLAKFSFIIKHLNKEHKMVNRGQLLVVGVIIGLLGGLAMGIIKGDSLPICLIIGLVVGLFLGRIYEIRAEHNGRLFN